MRGAGPVGLNQAIGDRLVTCRGLPPPAIRDCLARVDPRLHRSPRVESRIGRIDMVSNTGTYLDAPFQRCAGESRPDGTRGVSA